MPKAFSRHSSWYFWFLLMAAVIIIASNTSFLNTIGSITVSVFTSPVVLTKHITKNFKNKTDIISENETLRKEAADLSLEVARLEEAQLENDRLRVLLEFKRNLGFDTVAAQIVSREPNDWTGSVIIDRGTLHELSTQSAVCSSRGLLGKIVRAEKKRSFVELLTHPNFRAGGVVKASRINGVIVGSGKGLVRMLYIPMDAEIEEGAIILTSGLSRIFPKGIPVGRVRAIKKSKTGLYRYAEIKPFASIYEEEEVLCVKGYPSDTSRGN